GPIGDGAKSELDNRLARILDAPCPAPGHAQPLGLHDFEILPAALVLAAVEHAKAYPKVAANLQVELRSEHGTSIGSPPVGDAFGCRECIEYDRWPRFDPANERQTRHRLFFLVSASLRSA